MNNSKIAVSDDESIANKKAVLQQQCFIGLICTVGTLNCSSLLITLRSTLLTEVLSLQK